MLIGFGFVACVIQTMHSPRPSSNSIFNYFQFFAQVFVTQANKKPLDFSNGQFPHPLRGGCQGSFDGNGAGIG